MNKSWFKKGVYQGYGFKKGNIPWSKGKTNVYSEETLEKFSNAKIGNKNASGHRLSQESIELMKKGKKEYYSTHSVWNKGIPCSEETKRKNSEKHKGKNNPMYGRHLSDETKIKIGLGNKGRPSPRRGKHVSEETRRRMSESAKQQYRDGRKLSEAGKERIRLARLNQVFPMKDTSIEVKLQDGLKKLNIKFEKHKSIEHFVQCDLFIKPNIVIFCDGDYFHSCPKHFPDRIKLDSTQNKNLIRDTLVNQFFSRNGKYKVLRFYECDINNNFEDLVLDKIIFAVNENKKVGEKTNV